MEPFVRHWSSGIGVHLAGADLGIGPWEGQKASLGSWERQSVESPGNSREGQFENWEGHGLPVLLLEPRLALNWDRTGCEFDSCNVRQIQGSHWSYISYIFLYFFFIPIFSYIFINSYIFLYFWKIISFTRYMLRKSLV